MAVEELIWSYIGVSSWHGRLLTGMDVRKKVEIAKSLCQEAIVQGGSSREEFKKVSSQVWPSLDAIRNERNMLVHGLCYFLDKRCILAVSMRAKGGPESMSGMVFTRQRLERFIAITDHLSGLFSSLRDLQSALRTKPPEPPPEPLSTPPISPSPEA